MSNMLERVFNDAIKTYGFENEYTILIASLLDAVNKQAMEYKYAVKIAFKLYTLQRIKTII